MNERFESYEAAIRHLMQNTDYERMQRVRYNSDTFNLDRVTALMNALGNPERRFPSVHVAGTKGKGSTAAMIEALLRAHGLRTGLYTSPHLVDLRERIQIDRRWIDKDLMRRLIGRAADAVDAGSCPQPPTFFEVMTAVAFLAFAECAADMAVIEVGLGGRLDSTNVILPQVSVITGVSIDHTHQLGNDLAAIAAEKAGIVKPNVPLVLAPQEPDAEAVILRAATAAGAPVVRVGLDVHVTWEKHSLDNRPAGLVTVTTRRAVYDRLEIPLPGRFQAPNAACAIAAAEIVLAGRIDQDAVRRALGAVDWPGRMQTFPGDVTVVLDGAHNAKSLRELCTAVEDYFHDRPVVYLFASAADKDIPGMIQVLHRVGARVFFTRTDNPRAADPEELAAALRAAGGNVLGASPRIESAMHLARSKLGGPGVIVACGSLYLVGALLEHRERFGF